MTQIARAADPDQIATRAPTMWRYHEFLPLDDPEDADPYAHLVTDETGSPG